MTNAKKSNSYVKFPYSINSSKFIYVFFVSCCSVHCTGISFIRVKVYVGKIFGLGVIACQSTLEN